MRIIGIDPGLNNTGWGIIESANNSLSYVASGVIKSPASLPMAERLHAIDEGLSKIIEFYKPETSAIEETFINKNGSSSLKLGMARGVAFLAPARAGLDVGEYSANHIKKSVVGAGHADKKQVQMMVKVLLPKADFKSADAADALAIAICHAHNSTQTRKLA
ncbi:MAG: crossover junction endodeoxyribonuclease RuvC [Alphaproteobacteria bacterium]|nr:MAG: crossover junction endodeoxyribonuclease RuvC [Alphaproteobacteria bacterium]